MPLRTRGITGVIWSMLTVTSKPGFLSLRWRHNERDGQRSIVGTTVCSGADQRKHQSSASLAFGRGINRWPVNSPRKGPVTRRMFPFDDVIMFYRYWIRIELLMDLGGQSLRWLTCQLIISGINLSSGHKKYQLIFHWQLERVFETNSF